MGLNIAVAVIGIIVLSVGISVMFYKYNEGMEAVISKAGVLLVVVGLIVAVVVSQTFTIIPTGYTGVMTTFGQIDENKVLTNGFNGKMPFVQSIKTVNNKQTDVALSTGGTKIWGESSDKVQVYMADVTVTYQINPEKSSWIFANVSDTKDLIQYELVASSLKDSSASLLTKEVTLRNKIEPVAKENVQKALDEKYGKSTLVVLKVVINDMNFEDSYNEQISKKNDAEMKQQTQAITNKTNIDKAEANKKVKLTNAEATKEANQLLEKSITDKALQQQMIELLNKKWNGKFPQVVGGDNGFMLDVSKMIEGK